MNKVSDVLAERFSHNPLETYFWKQHYPGVWKDKLFLYDFGYANTFRNQKVFKLIATSKVRYENINFESDRTSSMLEKIKTKQSLLYISSSHLILSCQTNTTSKLNEYINKLTLPFCQLFHIPFFYNIFDQSLFYCYEKLFQPVHKKVTEIKKWLALNLLLPLLFSNV